MNSMNKYDFIKTIEKVNGDFLDVFNSKQYKTGDLILRGKRIIRSCDIRKAQNYLKFKKAQKKINMISTPVKKEDTWYYSGEPYEADKGCVFTCVTGHYDTPKEPLFIGNQDYILFTDEPLEYKSVWKCEDVTKIEKEYEGNDINRYYKMHPFEMLSNKGYKYALYIDGNIQVVSDISSLYKLAHDARSGFAMHTHWARRCIYDEALVCIESGKGVSDKIKEQIKRYRTEGFPEKYGLLEASIIMIDLENINAKKIFDDWWGEYKYTGSKRDQLALPYILWKNGYEIKDVGVLGNNLFYNPKFRNIDFGRHDGLKEENDDK